MTLSKIIRETAIKLGESLNDDNKAEILKQIKKIIITKTPSYRSQTVSFSLVKKIMKGYTKDEDFLKKIKASDDIIDEVIGADVNNRDNRKLIVISKDDINKILDFHMSDNLFEIAMFLLLISGRRTTELTNSNIKNVPKSNLLTIDHIVKRSDENQNLSFRTLIPKTVFLKNLGKFKRLYNCGNKKTFQRNLLRNMKKRLGDKFYPHLLRKIYAIYSFEMRNKDKVAINPFIRDALLQQSINSSMYYTGVKFEFKDDFIKKKRFLSNKSEWS